jgi:hypothetical protein
MYKYIYDKIHQILRKRLYEWLWEYCEEQAKKLTVPWLSMEGNLINGKWMWIEFKHILFAQICKKEKTQVKQSYDVFSYIQ